MNILKLLPFALIIGLIIALQIRGMTFTKSFYKKTINLKVVSSNDWQLRSIDFYLSDNTRINFTQPIGDKFKIGDSVSKPANSYMFKVYRKNETGEYEFFKEYNYEDSN